MGRGNIGLILLIEMKIKISMLKQKHTALSLFRTALSTKAPNIRYGNTADTDFKQGLCVSPKGVKILVLILHHCYIDNSNTDQ